jgi:hypothetical protein
MAHDQTQGGRPTAGRTLTRPGRRRKGPSAAVIIAVAGIVAWGPAAAAAPAGQAAQPGRVSPVAGAGLSPVKVPPTISVGNGAAPRTA